MYKTHGLKLMFCVLLVLVMSASAVMAIEPLIISSKGYPFYNTGGFSKKEPGPADARGGYADYVGYWEDLGTWIDWVMDIPESGDYYFFARYATHDTSYAERKLEVSLMYGEENYTSLERIHFPAGGNWGKDSWILQTADEKVTLKEGKNVVRMIVLETDQRMTGMNLLNFGFIKADLHESVPSPEQIIEITDSQLY